MFNGFGFNGLLGSYPLEKEREQEKRERARGAGQAQSWTSLLSEKVFIWVEVIFYSMVWEICLSCSEVWISSFSERLFCFLLASQGKQILVPYVDDIVITGDDAQGISELKLYL